MIPICTYTFRVMSVRRVTLSARSLPAGLLLAGSLLSFWYWPDVNLLLPDTALQGPLVPGLLMMLLALPLLAGLLATFQLHRLLVWPWLWLAALLMLNSRPQLHLVPQLLSLALELCLLLAFALTESLLIRWRGSWPEPARRLALPLAALPLLLLSGSSGLDPDNPAWQHWLALLAGCGLLGTALCEELAGRGGLARPRLRLPALPRLPRLPGISLPGLPHFRRTRESVGEHAPRERPMLSLEEGYLVSHPAEPAPSKERRRTG